MERLKRGVARVEVDLVPGGECSCLEGGGGSLGVVVTAATRNCPETAK